MKRKFNACLGFVIISTIIGGCGSQKENNSVSDTDTEKKNQVSSIDDFLNNEITIEGISDFDKNKSYWEKCDVDRDGEEELFIRTDKFSYILDENDNDLKVIFEGTSYNSVVCDDEKQLYGCLYYRQEGAPLHETYQFTSFTNDGMQDSLHEYIWCDMNENDQKDESDEYTIDNRPVNKSDWEEEVEKFSEYKK